MFKLFSVLFMCAYFALSEQASDEIKAAHDKNKGECIKELSVLPETLEKIKKRDFAERDLKVECFIKCTMDKYNLFDANGVFLEDVGYKLLTAITHADKVNAVVKQCKDVAKHEDKCSYAFDLWSCYSKELDMTI